MSTTQQVRDLILVRVKDREQCLQAAKDVLKQWAEDWLPANAGWQPDVQVSCCTESGMDDVPADLAHGLPLAKTRLAALLVGRERGQPLSEADWALQSAAAALSDLNSRMQSQAKCLQVDGSKPDLRKLSGGIVAKEQSLGLVWAWQSPAAVAAKPGAIDGVTSSVQKQRVKLAAGLGEVEIAVSDLLALQVGDVIRFPALLKSLVPLSIGAADQFTSAPVSAQLGARHGHVAIKLNQTPS